MNRQWQRTWATQFHQLGCQYAVAHQTVLLAVPSHAISLRLLLLTQLSLTQAVNNKNNFKTRMWANAQRDGHPAEYRWRPLFNAAKFGWRPLLECRAVTLPRREIRWNVLGCPKLANTSQPLVGQSSPYCEDVWGRHCCLTSFYRLSIHALVAKI